MRKVTCLECGKTYDYDVDDFCPRCGAYNIPAKAQRTSIRVDGLSESNHEDSFLHEELHAENAERKRLKLSKGAARTVRPEKGSPSAVRTKPAGGAVRSDDTLLNREWDGRRRRNRTEVQGAGKIVLWIIILIVFLINFFSR